MKRSHTRNATPQHVAIIMDGNGRWAKKRQLPRLEGHKMGAESALRVIDVFIEYRIPYLTLYAFSTENWNRPKEEVHGLFEIMESQLEGSISFAMEKGIRFVHLGKLDGLSNAIREKIQQATMHTRDNEGLTLCIAFNYGGRDEIVQAVNVWFPKD